MLNLLFLLSLADYLSSYFDAGDEEKADQCEDDCGAEHRVYLACISAYRAVEDVLGRVRGQAGFLYHFDCFFEGVDVFEL